jgi:hypothetical protein
VLGRHPALRYASPARLSTQGTMPAVPHLKYILVTPAAADAGDRAAELIR